MQIHGSKKGQSQPKKTHIAKDDLNSTSFYKGLYGLCEGEILGLADGGKSIKLDGTPLINASGQPNFKGVTWDFRAGTLDQSHISGFPAVENEQNIGVELRHDRPYTKAINNKELSAVRVRLNFNALREQKDNGDITGLSIEYAIDVQTDTGAFVEVLRQTIRGKASSGFKKSHRIDLPPAKKGWTIRIRRITPNRDSDLVADSMTVDAITEIIDAKLAYPCTALLGLTYNSKTFNNIAKLSVRLKGKIIQVPTNYNPDTRQYTGLWDGTFKLAYSNNPAWVFYDLCTHKRYGLGERLNGMVDKWRLYQIGQYCDELIDDGMGGKEPRFTVNVYIQKADDAYRVLQNLASVFRGMSFWDGQNIVVDADTPKEAVYTFSRANVVSGEFSYTGTRAKDRHSVVRVAWDNPDNDFKTEYEFVKDETAIISLGIRQLDINAFGCTSKGQAVRAGLWALKSEQLQTRTVSFKTGLQGFIPQVGQVINIADDIFAGRAISGRILSVNGKQITLDRTAGKVGDTLTVATADGVLSSAITAINDEIVTVNQALNVANDSIWAIVSHDLNLMQFRILSIAQNDDATFDITALQYEPQKFEAVDNGVHITPQPYSVLKATPITAPNSVSLTSSNRTVQGQALTTLTINWEQVTGAVAYIVKWRKDDGNWQTLPKISGQSVDIDGVYAGKYVAQVQAVDSFDNESLATTSQLTTINGKIGKPPRLAKLVVKGILFGMQIDWVFARGSEDTNFTEIQVSPDGRTNIATLGTFAYPTNKYEITGLQGGLTQFYRARIVDKLGNTSDWTVWTKGVTDSRADKVLDLLNGQITQSQLHNDLSAPIAKIGSIESNINAIGGKIPRIESTIGKIGGIENTLNTRLPSIQTDIGRLTNNIGTINTQIMVSEQQLNTAKQAIATAQNTLNTAVNNITTERNRINTAIRDINALQSANNAKTQEIANLTNTVGGHTSSIRELGVTTGNLSQKYSQLKTATDTANSQIQAIKQTQAGTATSIEQLGSRFDNLVVGGRNLLLNTQTLNPLWTIPTSIENGIATFVGTGRLLATTQRSDNIQALENGKVTISFTAKSNQDGRLHIRLRRFNTNNQLSDIAQYIAIDSREFKRYSLTLNYEKWKNQDRVNFEIATYEQAGFVCEVKLPKLEIGTIATDWTPAPEDLQSDIDSKATTANLENLRQTLTTADTALSQQITAMDTAYKSADRQLTANLASETTARTSADTALGQRIDTLTADYNGNKANLANQVKALVDKDTATASQISSLTANISTAKQTADTANGKADNAQSMANNALNRANTANSAITTEQRARADADNSLASRITALDTAYKSADNNLTSRLAREETARTNGDNANAQALRTLESTVNGIGGRIGTSESKIASLERTTADTNQALATAQHQMNAKFDNLSVGGRNLIAGTANHGNANNGVFDGFNVIKLVKPAERYIDYQYRLTRAMSEPNCVFSFWAKADVGGTILTAHLYNPNTVTKAVTSQGRTFTRADGLADISLSTEWKRYDVVYSQAPSDTPKRVVLRYQSIRTGTEIFIAKPKLEVGTIATDWTPAPEDLQTDIDSKAATANLENLRQTLTTADTALSQQITAMDTAYKSADRQLTANLASEQTARTSSDTALGQRIDSLTADYNGNKASIANQLKTLTDKDTATASQITGLTANVTTAQNTANTANSKADTATTKADNAQNTANNALNRANTANSAITAEQKARADADNSLASQITALDTAYKSADTATNAKLANAEKTISDNNTALSQRITALDTAYKKSDTDITARIAREETARTNGDNANSQAIRTLESTVNGRLGTSESKIASLERTTSDTNQALATAQSELNARFDNLAVGGRNYLLNSQTLNPQWGGGTTINSSTATFTANGKLIVLVQSSANIQALADGKVTISFMAKSNQDGRLHIRLRRYNTENKMSDIAQYITIDSREFKRYSLTLDYSKWTNQDRVNFEIATYEQAGFVCEVKLPKLEIGTIATDWTPAPEDMAVDLSPYATTASLNEFKQTQANKDSATAERITALDTAYKSADRTLTANLASEISTRTNADNALGQRIDTLMADYNGNKASIANQLKTLTDKDTATAQKLSQLESNLGAKANSSALDTLSTKVNQVDGKITAQVSKVNTLQSTLNGQTASIRQQATSIDGLKAQYTVKIDSGGRVAGIGLASGGGVSDFSVRADKFLIAPPSGNGKGDSPFMVLTTPTNINGTIVPSGTYIKSAYIAKGSIKMLHIEDSIQSDNYVQGRSGWRLYKNGELEINSTFGDGTRIQLNSRGLTGWYGNGQKAFELGVLS